MLAQGKAQYDADGRATNFPGGINGRQLADAARQTRPGLEILFITGYAENAVWSHGHLEPGMHVLTKPFTIEDLVRRTKEFINSKGKEVFTGQGSDHGLL